jgi:hypothetical protein
MKHPIMTGLLVFSLALNVAVGATVGRHLWKEQRVGMTAQDGCCPLSRGELHEVRKLWGESHRGPMMARMQQIAAKQGEVIDLIAKSPNDLRPAEKSVEELIQLRAQTERECLRWLADITVKLPENKREAFLGFVKGRACMAPGMGMGPRGRSFGRGCCPVPAPAESK